MQHAVKWERETIELPPENGWRVVVPAGTARTTCTCGLDTGHVPDADAARAFEVHHAATA